MSDELVGGSPTPPELSVVVPLKDEEAVLPELHRRLASVLDGLGFACEVVYVDDGSQDGTPRVLDVLRAGDLRVGVVALSRTFGHQAAVTAGLDHARGRAVVVIDGDLQDPPEVLPTLVARWREGHDVVYAVRRKRKEGIAKRLGYFAFYRLLGLISEVGISPDAGDFCLMDRRVVDALGALPERMRFVRGLRAFVGFRQVGVEYERAARAAGAPKYTFGKLLRLATDGLVSFSGYPLRLVVHLGCASIALAFALTAWVLTDAWSNQTAPRGWASLIVVVLFMSSVQLLSLGIIGEYIRLIFFEVKSRPSYIVSDYKPAGPPPAGSPGDLPACVPPPSDASP